MKIQNKKQFDEELYLLSEIYLNNNYNHRTKNTTTNKIGKNDEKN